MTRHRDHGSNGNVVTEDLKYLFRGELHGSLVAGSESPAAADKLKEKSLSKRLR
jgi:hypothetical protein